MGPRLFLPGFAILLLSFGSLECLRLAQTYQIADILYEETPETFLASLVETFAAGGDEHIKTRLARRLRVTRPVVRREIVANLVAGDGLSKLAPQPGLNRERLVILLEATEQALQGAPASPELWILLAAIRTHVVGIDEKAIAALQLARSLAPRERDLVLLRLNLARTTWVALSQADRQGVAEDFAVLEAAWPRQASAVRGALIAAGVQVPPSPR